MKLLMFASKPIPRRTREMIPILLTVCFLSSLVFRGLDGWSYSSTPLQLSAFGLVLLPPLRQHLAWRWLALFSLFFFAWIAWRDISNEAGYRQIQSGLKGLLYCLALLGAATLLDLRQWIQTLRLTILITLTGILFYIGQNELMRAALTPMSVVTYGLQTPLNRNELGLFLGLICTWSTALTLFQPRHSRWLFAPVSLLAWGLLIVNGGAGAFVGATAASCLMLWLLHHRLRLPLMLLLGLLIMTIYVLKPELFSRSTFWNLRDTIYLETWPHILQHAWLGAGSSYFQQVVSPTLSTGEMPKVHNIYLEFWLAYGLIGAIWLGLLIFYLGRQTSNLLTAPGRVIISGTVAFYLIYGLVDFTPLNPLFFSGVVGMGAMLGVIRRQWHP